MVLPSSLEQLLAQPRVAVLATLCHDDARATAAHRCDVGHGELHALIEVARSHAYRRLSEPSERSRAED
jgi:hypothetical protein